MVLPDHTPTEEQQQASVKQEIHTEQHELEQQQSDLQLQADAQQQAQEVTAAPQMTMEQRFAQRNEDIAQQLREQRTQLSRQFKVHNAAPVHHIDRYAGMSDKEREKAEKKTENND